jgi:hypothetical protein
MKILFLGEKMRNQIGLNITVERTALLEKLKANKERFAQSFTLLLEAYTKESEKYKLAYAEYTQKVANRTTETANIEDEDEEERQPIPPTEPINRSKDYDFYIAMVETHTIAEIVLNEYTFNSLWRDRWDWTRQHYSTIMMLSKAGGSGAIQYPNLYASAANYAGE